MLVRTFDCENPVVGALFLLSFDSIAILGRQNRMGDCRCHDVEVLFSEWLAGVPQVSARLLSTTLLSLRAVRKIPMSGGELVLTSSRFEYKARNSDKRREAVTLYGKGVARASGTGGDSWATAE